jgi:tetraacyldisaccharide 4'-kinase
MIPLGWLYSSVVGLRNAMFDRDILRARKLAWPVVSVGNISVGGSGKTPFVIMLGELLAEKGIWIDVLSRGYRRSTQGVLTVNAEGTANQFGDEPLLIARKLRCLVIVGEDRFEAGMQSEEDYAGAGSNPMHLLDDGFQHRQLHRDFDIVLLNQEDLDDRLLPSGRLREPLSSLKRADAVVVDSACPAELVPKGDFQLWRMERELDTPEVDSPIIAFCGIARPQRFFSDLRKRGLDVREEIVFRDHYRYNEADVQRLAAAQASLPGSRLVTTEKDAMNLGASLASLEPIVVKMRMTIADPDAALKFLLGTIAERRACH